jgi:hypothetical protein
MMEAIDILQEKLVGNFYSRFSVGDTFDLYFDGFWLVAQNVSTADEIALNNFLLNDYQPAKEAIDKEDVSKTTVICSTLRKVITEVFLAVDSTLTLVFENGVTLNFPTNTDIVDWHWALNENGADPYRSYIVGCFSSGEVLIGNC